MSVLLITIARQVIISGEGFFFCQVLTLLHITLVANAMVLSSAVHKLLMSVYFYSTPNIPTSQMCKMKYVKMLHVREHPGTLSSVAF